MKNLVFYKQHVYSACFNKALIYTISPTDLHNVDAWKSMPLAWLRRAIEVNRLNLLQRQRWWVVAFMAWHGIQPSNLNEVRIFPCPLHSLLCPHELCGYFSQHIWNCSPHQAKYPTCFDRSNVILLHKNISRLHEVIRNHQPPPPPLYSDNSLTVEDLFPNVKSFAWVHHFRPHKSRVAYKVRSFPDGGWSYCVTRFCFSKEALQRHWNMFRVYVTSLHSSSQFHALLWTTLW